MQQIRTKHNFLAQFVKKLCWNQGNHQIKHQGCILAYHQLFGGSYEGSLCLRFVRFPLLQAQLRGFTVRMWLWKEVMGQHVLMKTIYSTDLQKSKEVLLA